MTDPTLPPSISATAFCLSHCSAFTTQHWYHVYATGISRKERIPTIPNMESKEKILANKELEPPVKEGLLKWVDQALAGLVILESHRSSNSDYQVHNLHLSECYNCKKIVV